MECRKCSRDLDGVEHRMVAQWPFCVPCFEELLAGPRAPEPAAVEAPPEQAPFEAPPEEAAGDAPPETGRCRLCDAEVPEAEMIHLGFWRFCPACIRDVAENPEPPPEPEAPPPAPEEPIRPAPMTWVHCARCGRRVPEGGAKRIDDAPYCPDCHHAVAPPPPLPDLAALATPVAVALSPAPHADDAAACDGCGRSVPGERPLRVEGFLLCRACLRADPDLALEAAAARHRLLAQQR